MVSLIKLVCTDFSAPDSLSLVIRVPSTLLVQGGYILHGNFTSYFKKARGSECFICLFICFLYMLFLKCL